jgi:hypothetical protein
MEKFKKALKIAGIIIAGVVLLLSTLYFGLSWYGDWKFEQDLKETIEATNRPYLEDMYGGKTPQETLQMFIEAVEKEDFELASKYFVLSKQEEWRERFKKGDKSNFNSWLEVVKRASEDIKKEKPVWETKNSYVYADKDNIFFEFVKYPNVWKIKEI